MGSCCFDTRYNTDYYGQYPDNSYNNMPMGGLSPGSGLIGTGLGLGIGSGLGFGSWGSNQGRSNGEVVNYGGETVQYGQTVQYGENVTYGDGGQGGGDVVTYD